MNYNPSDPTPTLPPLLEEFCTALRDEIVVAKRNSSNNAIPLSNGHKIGEQGNFYQYAFLIDSVLNTPDGAPGDLIIPGKAPIEVTIVSVEGLRIVISVESDLGQFVPSARLQTNLTILMRKLIERIEKNAFVQNPAASRMLGNSEARGIPSRVDDEPELYADQLRALENALGHDLTAIWGPPGTGKTRTIGTITKHLQRASRSVLIVSHTNTAVDQAIKRVAEFMKDQLEDGVVVRVGDVKDEVLRSDYPYVLLRKQVERQSCDLVEEREDLIVQRQACTDELAKTKKTVSIIEWIDSARHDIESTATTIDELEKMHQQKQDVETELTQLNQQHRNLLYLHEHTGNILSLRKQLSVKRDKKAKAQATEVTISEAYKNALKVIHDQENRIEIAKRVTPLREELFSYSSPEEQKLIVAHLSEQVVKKKESLEKDKQEHTKAISLLKETQNAGFMTRLFKSLPKPDDQQQVVSGLSNKLIGIESEIAATQAAHASAIVKLSRIFELDAELSRYADVGSYTEELTRQKQIEDKFQKLNVLKAKNNSNLDKLKSDIEQLEAEEKQFTATVNGDPKDIYVEVCSRLQRYRELQQIARTIKLCISKLEEKIDESLSTLVAQLQEWEAIGDVPSFSREVLFAIRNAHSELASLYNATDLQILSEKIESLHTKIQELGSRIDDIDIKLAQVEREVIHNASVVGATLTKTYLSDIIQERKFDTVVLDEASMAPIPALWVAALLAEKNIILVGDFKQLPPIVQSNNELTKYWLGRDIFEASGLEDKWNQGKPPSHFVPLFEQGRMVPQISELANQFYEGRLRNGKTTPEGFQRFAEWYKTDWPHDNPIVLVDTGPLNAWVTSVVKGGNASRLNFLSATVAVDLSEQLLSPERLDRPEGTAKRILIISPYRAHSKLVSLLLQNNNHLKDDVIAGTVHSFQGSEADVVIFDLVADEPHFRVNLFMPTLDEQLKRLLNVGLTRAKFRLFILGDFDYCQLKGRKAFLGKSLLPFLLKTFPRIDAREIVPNGLAARAAKAQMTMLGGEIDPDSERIVIKQTDFYRLLLSDLSRAHNRIIIYSPFITRDRIAFLMPQIQDAISRGVHIFVVTKAHSERPKSEIPQIRIIEAQLSDLGVVIIHKLRMHEKLVFIDKDITWSGSLNPLSFSNTQEIMERRKSKTVLEDYFQILRLEELIVVPGNPESSCPICGSEMIASEGADQPYYWRCVNDECYTRSIDQPYPFNGVLTCSACNSPVKFGYWGGYPHWRCTSNSRHRQKIFKSHLRLPKMASLIPHRERHKVCKLLHIDSLEEYILGSESFAQRKESEQMNLFE